MSCKKEKNIVDMSGRTVILSLENFVHFPHFILHISLNGETFKRIKDNVFVVANPVLGEKISAVDKGVLAVVTEDRPEGKSMRYVVAELVARVKISDVQEHGLGKKNICDCHAVPIVENKISEERWESGEFRGLVDGLMKSLFSLVSSAREANETIVGCFKAEGDVEGMAEYVDRLNRLYIVLKRFEKLDRDDFSLMVDEMAGNIMEWLFIASPEKEFEKDFLLKMRNVLFEEDLEKRAVLLSEAFNHAAKNLMGVIDPNGVFPEMEDEDANYSIDVPRDLPDHIRKKVEKILGRADTNSMDGRVNQEYAEWLCRFPWNRKTEDESDFKKIRERLEADHDGLENIKERIAEFIAVRKTKADAKAPILLFVGPPGVGKTSLGQSIASALGRKFIRQSLAGLKDEAELRGHRRTYVGALPGIIIQRLCDAASRSPVFMLDEADKLGEHGKDIPAHALLEICDPEQNDSFRDHYLDEPVDLSEVLFILTANTVLTIDEMLLDRAEIIEFSAYTEEEKIRIARLYTIGKVLRESGIEPENLRKQNLPVFTVEFTYQALEELIGKYSADAGMRDTERNIKKIISKILKEVQQGNLEDLLSGANGNGADFKENEFTEETRECALEPQKVIRVGIQRLRKFLGDPKKREWMPDLNDLLPGVIPILVVDGNGQGKVSRAEVSFGPIGPQEGPKIKRTGNLQDVIKESVGVALDRLTEDDFGVLKGRDLRKFIHVHLPDGATPKDGPSAGLAIFAAIYSRFIKKPVKPLFSVTGEIALRSRVCLPVGGIDAKLIAAHKAGIREVAIPLANKIDLKKIPKNARIIGPEDLGEGKSWKDFSREEKQEGSFTIYCVETPEDVLEIAFPDDYPPQN